MRRAVLLSLLVLVSLPVSVTGGALATEERQPSPRVTTIEHNPDFSALPIDQPRRTANANQSLDVATAIDIHRSEAQIKLNHYALENALQSAADDGARREHILQAMEDLEDQTTRVQTDEESLRGAYVNRSITAETYLHQLGRLHAEANHLQSYLAFIETSATQVPGLTLRSRIGTVNSALVTTDGPLRDRIVSTIVGTAPPARLFVEGSPNGIVLASISNGQYTREAYRGDHRTTPPREDFELDQAVSRIAALYPIAYNESIRTGIGLLADGLYRVTMEVPQGTITAYLDGGSQNIVYEVQQHDLDQFSGQPGVERIDNGTRLVVNQTYQGGPLRIATYDNTTGALTRASVRIDDRRVDLGPTGERWVLAPGGSQVTVTAIRESGTVSVTLSLDPPEMLATIPPET